MNGIQLDYTLKKGTSSRFNQLIFGRISSKTQNDKYYSTYIPGILDAIKFFKIYDGRLFLENADIDFDNILKFCNTWKTAVVDKNNADVHMRTGRERLAFRAKERGIKVNGLN